MQADVDNDGAIDYIEFIAATLNVTTVDQEVHLLVAFSYFDKDGSGYITPDELQQACKEFGVDDTHLQDMIGEVDQDNVSIFILSSAHFHLFSLTCHSSYTACEF